MAREHEKMTVLLLGEPFTGVHLWLDEFHETLGAKHRRKRHHLKGIQEVRALWGGRAADAAKQHIIDDLKLEGWKDGDHFPIDEADYVRMGLF
jgi:hypothetical protein